VEEEGKRDITEKGQVGMESTGHWTWGCGCHKTCIHNLIKQEFEKSKTVKNRERCWLYKESWRGRLAQNLFFLGSQNLQRLSSITEAF